MDFCNFRCRCSYFYPRSPCGERQRCHRHHLMHHRFLSTLSLRRATHILSHSSRAIYISIHALLAESDICSVLLVASSLYFYPRSPCGERLSSSIHSLHILRISIHALLAESDSKSAQNSGALLRIWNKFYGDCIFMLTGKAVFYPFCPCFFHIFWCEGTENFMIAFPSH